MAKVRIKYNRAAFNQLRTSAAAQADVAARAERIAAACGEGYEAAITENPRRRARAAVIAITPEAKADNARNQTLIRNLEAGR